jgi:competence protein ComEC
VNEEVGCKGNFMFKILAVIFLLTFNASAEDLILHFLSVGHGDATFIEFPNGITMLVDGGNYDMGKRIGDYIGDLGYEKIDYLVLTHSHDDHIGGLLKVANQFEIGEVWICPYMEKTAYYRSLDSLFQTHRIKVRAICEGDRYDIGGVYLRGLHPPLGSSLERLRGANGASVVMRLSLNQTSVLLSADIDDETDEELTTLFGDSLKSTILKCPHHASPYSNSEKFLSAVSPEVAVVSVGPSIWGYPSEETFRRIKRICPRTYRTDIEGDIVITLNGEYYQVDIE